MRGRIVRPDNISHLELPEIGRLHIGLKTLNKYGKEIPASVDYFIAAGKYSGLFHQALGEKPSTISIIFPDDDATKVCNERYEYRDNSGALVARGDGESFEIWNGKQYASYSISQYPDIMDKIAQHTPKKARFEGDNGWDVALTLRFIIPAVRGVVGVWQFTTKGAASSINNIRNSFDGVQNLRGSVRNTVFDLSVQFAKSNKPGQNSKYPVVSLVGNDTRIEEIKAALTPDKSLNLLLESK